VNKDKNMPIYEKYALTIEEAALYTNIGQNKIAKLAKDPRSTFVLYVGNKKLIKRKEFEDYLSSQIEL